ncbi:MAG: PepSY-associated TM helix domain-containing protein [Methylococcaceae bacterium]|jgi:uncharacterized iron-regulated membrane protein
MQIVKYRRFSRANWLNIHLYLALSAGLFFVILGITGSISVYRDELDELLNPQLVVDQPLADYLPLDKIMAAVRMQHPNRLGAWTLEMPRTPHGMITAWFDKPRETFFEYYAPLMVSVNPYTAEVVASRFWGQTTVTWILDLHTQLRMERWGWQCVGGLGFLMLLSILSGLYLWWPGYAQLKTAFRLRCNSGVLKLAFDGHKLLGFLGAPALLILAFTGFQLSFPVLLENLTQSTAMTHGNNGPNIRSSAQPNNRPIVLEDAEFIARGAFKRSQLRRITTPVGETGTYRVNLRLGRELNQKHPLTMVWVDRWSGHIREVRDPGEFSTGQRFASLMWPLHTGEALGDTGRRVWFMTGFIPLVLYLTGLLHWLHRRGKIRDRQIDYVGIKAAVQRLGYTCYRLALRLAHWLLPILKQQVPVIKASADKLTVLAHQLFTRLTK